MPALVVLLGPPGSGKTAIGRALASRGFRWREWERELVARWGSRAHFLAVKDEALPALHDEVAEWVAEGGVAVFETTGLSDAPLVVRLRATTDTVVVRLDVSEDEAVRRLAARERGEHLTDDVEPSRAVWRAFQQRVAGDVAVDLVVDTETMPIEAIAERIGAMTSAAPRRQNRMRTINDVMEQERAARGVPGMAWAIARGDDVAVGWSGTADAAGRTPVARDTIFRIASMSKPITAVAALTLVEDGTLGLDDRVDDLLPELADRRVLRDPDGPVDDTVPASRPVTLRDLLTFRMGLGMDFTRFGRQPHMDRMSALGVGIAPPSPQGHPDDDEYLARIGSLPLEFQPGERWLYHTGADVLGVLLARAEHTTLGEVLRRRVLAPLGMTDTAFSVPADKLDRFTDCIAGSDLYDAVDGQWGRPPSFESAGGGLVSTVDDYLAFATALREGGAPLLSRSSVELLTTDHLTAEQRTTCGPAPDGSLGWGFGLAVTAVQTDETAVGTYGWNGGLGSSWANDPVADVVTILLTNQMFTSPELPPVHRALRAAAYGAHAGQPKA